jgi:hypothetical protein
MRGDQRWRGVERETLGRATQVRGPAANVEGGQDMPAELQSNSVTPASAQGSTAENNIAGRPIFIHACWRTGSTYIWSKFRAQDDFCAYLEPLHDAFIKTNVKVFEDQFDQKINRVLRHPELARHYFCEYPFRPEGGVEKFEEHFPYERYCLSEKDSDPALHAYIAHLILLARQKGQRPVLQFNRGLLRSRWLTRHFQPVNILLLRNPCDIWASFCSFSNPYFRAVLSCILGQNGSHPLFAPLWEIGDVPSFCRPDFEEDYSFYQRFAEQAGECLRLPFYYFYALTSLYNLAACDVVIDINAITQSEAARRNVTQQLDALGIRISLDDCKIPTTANASDDQAAGDTIQREVIPLLREHLGRELAVPPAVAKRVSAWLSEPSLALLEPFVAQPSETADAAHEMSACRAATSGAWNAQKVHSRKSGIDESAPARAR